MSRDLTLKLNRPEFRRIMRGAGARQLVGVQVARAKYRAESVSGLSFGAGVDDGRVSCHGWVGASSVDARTGRPNAGLHKKQVAALSQALHGI